VEEKTCGRQIREKQAPTDGKACRQTDKKKQAPTDGRKQLTDGKKKHRNRTEGKTKQHKTDK
jgi:hypothetical protein